MAAATLSLSLSLCLAPSPTPPSASSSSSSSKHPSPTCSRSPPPHTLSFSGLRRIDALHFQGGRPSLSLRSKLKRGGGRIVCAVGDVSSEGTNYLIIGAIAIALVGSAFPLLFSRKDLCPECDGAGFIRKPGAALAANAARKDEQQIVCPRCNGLGKLGQVDK